MDTILGVDLVELEREQLEKQSRMYGLLSLVAFCASVGFLLLVR